MRHKYLTRHILSNEAAKFGNILTDFLFIILVSNVLADVTNNV